MLQPTASGGNAFSSLPHHHPPSPVTCHSCLPPNPLYGPRPRAAPAHHRHGSGGRRRHGKQHASLVLLLVCTCFPPRDMYRYFPPAHVGTRPLVRSFVAGHGGSFPSHRLRASSPLHRQRAGPRAVVSYASAIRIRLFSKPFLTTITRHRVRAQDIYSIWPLPPSAYCSNPG